MEFYFTEEFDHISLKILVTKECKQNTSQSSNQMVSTSVYSTADRKLGENWVSSDLQAHHPVFLNNFGTEEPRSHWKSTQS